MKRYESRSISEAIHTLDLELGKANEALRVSQWELGDCGSSVHNALQNLVGVARGVIENWETL